MQPLQILQRIKNELRYRPRILGRKYCYRGKECAKQAAATVGNFVKHDLLWMRYGKQKPPRYLNKPFVPNTRGGPWHIVELKQQPNGSWKASNKNTKLAQQRSLNAQRRRNMGQNTNKLVVVPLEKKIGSWGVSNTVPPPFRNTRTGSARFVPRGNSAKFGSGRLGSASGRRSDSLKSSKSWTLKAARGA